MAEVVVDSRIEATASITMVITTTMAISMEMAGATHVAIQKTSGGGPTNAHSRRWLGE